MTSSIFEHKNTESAVHSITSQNSRPQTLDLCRGWLALDAELEVLSARWRLWETPLTVEHDWQSLSDEERAVIPYAGEFLALESRMRTLALQLETTLPLIVDLPAKSPEAVAAKLVILERQVCPTEHPEIHALASSAARDAKAVAIRAR